MTRTRLLRPALLSTILAPMLLAVALPVPAQDAPLTTVSERSGFVQTGRYAEVIELCDAFAAPIPMRCVAGPSAPPRKAGR